MTLLEIKNCLLNIIAHDNEWFGIARIDANREKAICIYRRAKAAENNIAVGGMDATGYKRIPLNLLIRWTSNADTAERKAMEIHEQLINTSFFYNGQKCFVQTVYSSAIALGADEKDIFEYSVDFEIIIESN